MAGRQLPPALNMSNFSSMGVPGEPTSMGVPISASGREVHLHSNFGDYRISREGLRGQDANGPSLDDIQLFRRQLLGRGSSGDVFCGLHRPTGRPLAIKQIPLFDNHNQDSVIKELTALNAEKSRYIVEFFGAYYDHDNGSILIALERLTGSLQRLVCLAPIDEVAFRAIASQCLRALRVLHKRGVLHRDVKPSNILYDSDGQIKLADFGIASMPVGTHHAHTFIGTLAYMSPERVRGRAYTHSADVWGVGLVLFVLAAGEHPFKKAETWRLQQLFDEVGVFQLPDEVAARYDGPIQSFIRKMLTVDTSLRASVDELLADPFLDAVRDLPDGHPGLLAPLAELLPRLTAIEKERDAQREVQLQRGLQGIIFDSRQSRPAKESAGARGGPLPSIPTTPVSDHGGDALSPDGPALLAADDGIGSLVALAAMESIPVSRRGAHSPPFLEDQAALPSPSPSVTPHPHRSTAGANGSGAARRESSGVDPKAVHATPYALAGSVTNESIDYAAFGIPPPRSSLRPGAPAAAAASLAASAACCVAAAASATPSPPAYAPQPAGSQASGSQRPSRQQSIDVARAPAAPSSAATSTPPRPARSSQPTTDPVPPPPPADAFSPCTGGSHAGSPRSISPVPVAVVAPAPSSPQLHAVHGAARRTPPAAPPALAPPAAAAPSRGAKAGADTTPPAYSSLAPPRPAPSDPTTPSPAAARPLPSSSSSSPHVPGSMPGRRPSGLAPMTGTPPAASAAAAFGGVVGVGVGPRAHPSEPPTRPAAAPSSPSAALRTTPQPKARLAALSSGFVPSSVKGSTAAAAAAAAAAQSGGSPSGPWAAPGTSRIAAMAGRGGVPQSPVRAPLTPPTGRLRRPSQGPDADALAAAARAAGGSSAHTPAARAAAPGAGGHTPQQALGTRAAQQRTGSVSAARVGVTPEGSPLTMHGSASGP